ncbi:arginine/serine-rich coiled-coil protein 2 isoform X2 [Orussus abietinus]|uniref:arginine/serine-rich coiled-coil protein 2 isoform X2 n=1 Tax=Orussus abietinus TaxID=222816 RepID=UPI0006251516|nr:arginine/serine-rich coiled-coil protein 2 isoform X2 [Orussus abietinus]
MDVWKTKTSYGRIGAISNRRASDANYDPVQMDMSEESNNNNSSGDSGSDRASSPVTARASLPKTSSSRSNRSPSNHRRTDHESHASGARDEPKRSEKQEKSKHSTDRSRRSPHEDRKHRDSEHKDGKESSKRSRDDERKPRDDDRRSRDEERRRDRISLGSSREEKHEDKEKSEKDHRYREDRRDRSERERRRERERDRRRSRDDRSRDHHRDDRSNHYKDKDRPRSRSKSRDRAPIPARPLSYRDEKGRSKLAQLEKLGIELKAPEGESNTPNVTEQHYYNPLATATQGKYAEQIQKRKLLWANKSKPEESKGTSAAASNVNTWVGTTFTHDQDGKVTAKFKRLMGIKGDLPAVATPGAKPDILKKQEEMFSNMEQQYEVARATTHTQRGVGLGYATGGYQFPR